MAAAPTLNQANIQGNILAGFNKDFQTFLFVTFPGGSDARGWVAQITPDVASMAEVATFNQLFKAVNARRGAELSTVEATWMNVAFSASGLEQLGVSTADMSAFDTSFRAGMAAQAPNIGDVGQNDPTHWESPFGSTGIHAVVLLASDDESDLDEATLRHEDLVANHGLSVVRRETGRARRDLPGHEHFGFKDGVSQPGIRWFTDPDPQNPDQGQPGQDLLWPGEFVLGYPTQQKPPPPPQPIPGPPNYGGGGTLPPVSTSSMPTDPGPDSQNGPPWSADGSYLVFRKLAQDVPGFWAAVSTTATTEGKPAALIGAKFVGRYASGCPLEPPSDRAAGFDTQTADPSIADPTLLDDDEINNFEYDGDAAGQIVPRAAHIRKAYPRNEPTPGGGEADTQTHRVLRRGIAFGEPFDPGAPAGTAHAADAERGLLFLCYQRSLADQFEFVQQLWVNNPNFPQSGDGEDPVISQQATPRAFTLSGALQPQLQLPEFVTTRGGEYFFQPSISALSMLGVAGP